MKGIREKDNRVEFDTASLAGSERYGIAIVGFVALFFFVTMPFGWGAFENAKIMGDRAGMIRGVVMLAIFPLLFSLLYVRNRVVIFLETEEIKHYIFKLFPLHICRLSDVESVLVKERKHTLVLSKEDAQGLHHYDVSIKQKNGKLFEIFSSRDPNTSENYAEFLAKYLNGLVENEEGVRKLETFDRERAVPFYEKPSGVISPVKVLGHLFTVADTITESKSGDKVVLTVTPGQPALSAGFIGPYSVTIILGVLFFIGVYERFGLPSVSNRELAFPDICFALLLVSFLLSLFFTADLTIKALRERLTFTLSARELLIEHNSEAPLKYEYGSLVDLRGESVEGRHNGHLLVKVRENDEDKLIRIKTFFFYNTVVELLEKAKQTAKRIKSDG